MKNVCRMQAVSPPLLKAFTVPLLLVVAYSARATIFEDYANLNGPSESPANTSLATGFGVIDYNDTLHTLALNFSWSGLQGTTTASHIHAATTTPLSGTAGVATTTPYFAGFPIGVTSGSYANTLDLTLASSWNNSYITANGGTTASAESALAAAMASGRAYLNIHSTVYGGGEIRGFLVVPEPSSLELFGVGACGALAYRARGRR